MKKQLPLYVFLMLFCIPSVHADEFSKNHGIGVLQIDLDSLTSLDFWQSPDDKLPSHVMEIRRELLYPELLHFTFDRLNQDSFPLWFNPIYFHSDVENRRLDFNCLEEKGQYYKTNLNCEPGKFLWIQKSKRIVFNQWISFYQSVASVEYVGDTILLYDKPISKTQGFPFYQKSPSSRILLSPIEIKGMWMKVDIIETDESGDQLRKNSGWILWRNEKEPLITFNIMGC